MGGKHNKCCCDAGCVIASDDFLRDGTDLGSDWTHDTGEWITVLTGAPEWGYAESQVDGAQAIHHTIHPVPDTSGHVFINIGDETVGSGNIYRVIINAVDGDNYHYAEYELDGGSTSTLTLGKRSSGVDSIILTDTVPDISGTSRNFSARMSDTEFCCNIGGTLSVVGIATDLATPIPMGYYAGMGGSDGVRINDWSFLQHEQTKAGCGSCTCQCEGATLPLTLNAHLEGTGRMAGLDCDIEIVWDMEDQSWRGAATCCEVLWTLRLECPGVGATTSRLTITDGCLVFDQPPVDPHPPEYVSAGVRYANSDSTCDPLYLSFGLFWAKEGGPMGDDSCLCGYDSEVTGTWTVVITESP